MKKISLFIFICILVGGCNRHNGNHSSKPLIWVCDLESYKWIYGGLDKIYTYDDIVIANTTLASNEQVEDNRLVGVNANTGEIEWMYPSDRNQTYNYNFYRNGYLYNNLLLAASQPNGQLQSNAEIHCIDVAAGGKIWDLKLRDDGGYINFIGYDKYAYYQLNNKIYRIDIITGDTMSVYTPQTKTSYPYFVCGFYNGVSYKNYILLHQLEYDENRQNSVDLILMFNTETNQVDKVINIPTNSYGWGARGSIEGDFLYISSYTTLMCYDLSKERFVWQKTDLQYWPGSTISVYNNIIVIYSDSSDYGVSGYDTITGKFLWRLLELYGAENVNWDGNYLYVQSIGTGGIGILDIKTGRIIKHIEYREQYGGFANFQKLAFSNNKFYVKSWTSLYCISTYPWK